jgi:general secretion pathway protein G
MMPSTDHSTNPNPGVWRLGPRAWRKPGVWRLGPRACVKAASAAFTLIELLVVFAILALLVSLAVPRYFTHIERAKEATLKQDLSVMRDAIDKFYGDKGRYPDTLEELVEAKYIRSIPVDPITESATTWTVVPPPSDANAKGEVYDVKSGAEGTGAGDKPYADW